MMVSPPDFTPMEFRPTMTQTVRSVKTDEKGSIGLDFFKNYLNESECVRN